MRFVKTGPIFRLSIFISTKHLSLIDIASINDFILGYSSIIPLAIRVEQPGILLSIFVYMI